MEPQQGAAALTAGATAASAVQSFGVPMSWYLILSALLFAIGVVGVLIKRNPIVIFMSIELMLNSVNLSFITFARYLGDVGGQMFAIFVMAVAAAEVAVGLAILISIFRSRENINVDEINLMQG